MSQSGLLAAVAAQLLTFFSDDSKFTHPESAARDAILTLTYISLIHSILLTMASVAMTAGVEWADLGMDSIREMSPTIAKLLEGTGSIDLLAFQNCTAVSPSCASTITLMQCRVQGLSRWVLPVHAPWRRFWSILCWRKHAA